MEGCSWRQILTDAAGRSPPPPPPRDPQDAERDVFAKSDKWLPSLPVIDFSSWKDRISEALGFLTWMEKLTSWVGLGSEVFPNELAHAVRTKDESVLAQDRLTVEQQKRSIRLLHILRQTFAGHDKSSLILQNYVEGASSYQQSGFVALRLLAKEFCLKSRSECLYFRSQLANQTVKAPSIPEIVRKIESEQHKYVKLLNSLDADVHSQGLELQEADLVMVLLRSLPERCRSYCLLHGDSDSFEDLKRVALKYEVQQRVWSEGPGTKLNPFQPDKKRKGGDEKGDPKGKGKKGKRGRSQSASRGSEKGNKDTVCFNCGKKGHFARDCWAPKKNDGKDTPDAKGKDKPTPKSKGRPKGGKDKGKGKGKTVAEVSAADGEGVDLTGDQEWTEPEAESHVSAVRVSSVLRQLNEIVDEARWDWIPPTQDEVVMTRETGFKVRMAELEHRIENDLAEMLGKEVTGSVSLLRGSPVNGVSSLSDDQLANWWLIDSGASVTVIAKKFLECFSVVSRTPLCPHERYSAANETPVTVFERVRVRVKMPLYEGDSYLGMIPVMVTGVVADVGHNILSTEHTVDWLVTDSVGYDGQDEGGVTQHRRGKDLGNRPVELQADFCFINLVTGTFVKDGWLCPCRDKRGPHSDLDQVYDPKDTLAPPILKELEDGIPDEVEGEVDKAFEGKVSQGPTTDMSQVGPPAAWVREHGGTPGCPACGEKRGKANHNAACKRRYDKWLKDQRARLVGDGERVSGESEPGLGSGMAPKMSSEARSSEDAGVLEASAPLLKRPKTSDGSADEAPSAESKPEVIDVEMFEDPRLDSPEGLTYGVGEHEVPKLASVVNAVLIDKNAAFPEPMKVCGSKVWLAKMKSALSELDGCPLDVSSAMDGRRTELLSMDSHKAGRIVSGDEAHSFAKKHGIRIIPTRWVLGPKVVNGKEAVRARCVVQDVAKGSTASSLGLSATTPSLEALRTLLAIAAKESMDIATLDVSTAFLHSPLPKGEKAVIMLPRDVSSSSEGYVPVYMILDQAMNGLRVAAKAWNLKLANVVN
ncbi:Retrovirus-related Pol polyprotein from transposon TNT 1-94 [Symbiodinium microadriaticum]|uniref:Retrovirus-related Pol polyprotein from transposon TNT 1-94 n=1 Tax=Symbiodinium microadriaticum TaxID=2951 RepID=A0A1Q9BY34_SYMMI|nr:Retrovirus-related Pol polyprotein from transposon TNT 1-94 [Symbiodinium microadriaticum]